MRTRDEALTSQPGHVLLDVVHIPHAIAASPWTLIARRVGIALLIVFAVALIVYIDGGGYSEDISPIDALYYATVTLSTTGYGDITPVTQSARLFNILLITPLRIAFVVLLVGTTLSVLTDNSRKSFQIQRWRKTVRDHTVVIGYGSKGRSAVSALLADGVPTTQIVVVDNDRAALNRAEHDGLVTVQGSGTKADVLRLAGTARARSVVVAPSSDDTAVLVTLSAREIAPQATIVASVRESDKKHLVEQSGADSVIISSETAGRLLGLSTVTPSVVEMMEDLLSPADGFGIDERTVTDSEVGLDPRELAGLVLAVVRDGELHRLGTTNVEAVRSGDRILHITRPSSQHHASTQD